MPHSKTYLYFPNFSLSPSLARARALSLPFSLPISLSLPLSVPLSIPPSLSPSAHKRTAGERGPEDIYHIHIGVKQRSKE